MSEPVKQKILSIEHEQRCREIFEKANFIREVGYRLEKLEIGFCETSLLITEKHLQQNRFIHAGVQSTMADHSAGTAAGTIAPLDKIVLSVEFKINLLRPAIGNSLVCRSNILKNGKTLIVAESEIYTFRNGKEKLVSKSTVTLALVGKQFE